VSKAFQNPSLEEIRALLQRVRTIAVVGLSPKADRPSHQVAVALQRFGYRVVPVRPMVKEVLGEKAYPDLASIPDKIDLVDVFRAPEHVDEVVDACIALRRSAVTAVGIPRSPRAEQARPWALWLQDGVVNEPAAQRARDAGITVVMDRCVFRDYVQLCGAGPRCAP
jgi:predicted CoA-binding protein